MVQSTKKIIFSRVSFSLACATLPFVDLLPLCTYFFIITACSLLFTYKASFFSLKDYINPLTLLFFSFYLYQVVAWLIQPDAENAFSLEQKAALAIIPIIISVGTRLVPQLWSSAIAWYIGGCIMAGIASLINAFRLFLQDANPEHFFYHKYSSAINANAIYLSLHLLICMSLLHFYSEKNVLKINSKLRWLLLFFLYGSIILLSSRAAILSASILVLYMLISSLKLKKLRFARLAGLGIILLTTVLIATTNNPVKNRFQEIHVLPEEILKGKDFSNYPFNGLDLRLLLWRMGIEVLGEHDKWLTGMGGRTYHHSLNAKMRSYHLFEGDAVTQDTGYINMDMHNQYIDNLIQFGLAGLLLLVVIQSFVIYDAIRMKNINLLFFVLIFSLSFLTESLLETQAGILLFVVLIYGEWKHTKMSRV